MEEAPATLGQLSLVDTKLVEGLRRGDELSFLTLLRLYSASLLRMARMYTPSIAVAEEVVQETWLGVLESAQRFEGRSSIKTWLFRILLNRARTRGQREGRSIPFSQAFSPKDPDAPELDPDRFLPEDHPKWPHHWAKMPTRFGVNPEGDALQGELLQNVQEALQNLPNHQREVVTLRDVEGLSSEEVCQLLSVSEANQRVLLHRGRAKIRSALEQYLAGE